MRMTLEPNAYESANSSVFMIPSHTEHKPEKINRSNAARYSSNTKMSFEQSRTSQRSSSRN